MRKVRNIDDVIFNENQVRGILQSMATVLSRKKHVLAVTISEKSIKIKIEFFQRRSGESFLREYKERFPSGGYWDYEVEFGFCLTITFTGR